MQLVLLFLFIVAYWHLADYLEIHTRRHRKMLQEALAFDESWCFADPQPVPVPCPSASPS